MLHKLSSGQGRPSKKTHFWSCDLSDWLKCHRSIFRKISQGYCIHLPNMKKIRFMSVKLLRKENADPAESLLPYTIRRTLKKRYLVNFHQYLVCGCTLPQQEMMTEI